MEKELAFDVCGGVDIGTDYAAGTIFSTCEYGKKDLLSEELFKVTEKFMEEGPTGKELEGARTRIIASHCRTFLTAENIAAAAGGAVLHTGGVESIDAYIRKFDALTPGEIRDAGRKYFNRNQAAEVQLLPQEKAGKKKFFAVNCGSKAPESVTFRTKNGYKVVHLQDKDNAFICLSLLMPCGIYCGKGNSAAGPLLADLLPTGTEKYTEEEISELTGENAISMDFRAGNATLKVAIVALREKWDVAMDILHSILHEPLFDKKKLERERLSLLEEYKSNLANPEFVSFETFFAEMAGEPHAPRPEEHLKSISTLSASSLKKIFENVCLSPEKAVLGLSGSLTEKEAEAFAERLLGDLKVPGKKLPVIPFKKHKKGINRVTLPLEKSQAVFLTGFPACTAGHRRKERLICRDRRLTTSERYRRRC